jgi:hypothetical protein
MDLDEFNWTPPIYRVNRPALGLDQRDFAVEIGLFVRMSLEGNAADSGDAFEHRERMARVFGVLQASNHGLRSANTLGELGLSQPRILHHLAHQ